MTWFSARCSIAVLAVFCLAAPLSAALGHDARPAAKKRSVHRARSSSPQIIPQKPRPGVQTDEAESLYYGGVASMRRATMWRRWRNSRPRCTSDLIFRRLTMRWGFLAAQGASMKPFGNIEPR